MKHLQRLRRQYPYFGLTSEPSYVGVGREMGHHNSPCLERIEPFDERCHGFSAHRSLWAVLGVSFFAVAGLALLTAGLTLLGLGWWVATGSGDPMELSTLIVTANMFDVLGLLMLLVTGHPLTPALFFLPVAMLIAA